MEKFITIDELRDIVSELADNFMESKRYNVNISLDHLSFSDDLIIYVADRESSHKIIYRQSFKIIEKPKDAIDVSRIVKMAIKQHEAEMASANNEAESPIEL